MASKAFCHRSHLWPPAEWQVVEWQVDGHLLIISTIVDPEWPDAKPCSKAFDRDKKGMDELTGRNGSCSM